MVVWFLSDIVAIEEEEETRTIEKPLREHMEWNNSLPCHLRTMYVINLKLNLVETSAEI